MRLAQALAGPIVLLVLVAPLGVALDISDPLPTVPLGGGSMTVETASYTATIAWPTHADALATGGVVFGGTIQHAGREAQIAQALKVGDVFFRAEDLVDDRFFVIADQTVNQNGDPVLDLRVSRTPVANDVPEIRGHVTLTFTPDAILHAYEFHMPYVVAANSIFSTTTLEWDTPFGAHGSVHPNGDVQHDDGASLDPLGAWEAYGTYGVFLHDDGDALAGHARLRQGDSVNYLDDGVLRASPTSTSIFTVFSPFLDAPSAGQGQGLRAEDAIVFEAADVAPEQLRGRLGEILATIDTGIGDILFDPSKIDEPTPTGPIPHVLMGVPDSGINPYHEMYYRPNLTVHPCTYIEDFPCDIPALPLSVGQYDDWQDAWDADKALWDSLEYLKWYWIPQTVFVAVMCEGTNSAAGSATEGENLCLIDDSNMHGTGTTSSILSENPNALIAFKEGNSATSVFEDGLLPIDIISYSWGPPAPLVTTGILSTPRDYSPFFVAASGNEGAFPVILDTDKASHAVITVGGADAATRTEYGYTGWKTAEFVSQYCRPTAQTRSVDGYRASYCGTSFAAPTFAGALSKIVLDLRRESGYTGSIVDQMVDPILGVSKWDVRDALNRTASYAPEARFPAQPGLVPLAESAPAYQWGWGYVDGNTVDAALACIRDNACPVKDSVTVAYMDALWAVRDVNGGWDILDLTNCFYNRTPDDCNRLPMPLRRLFGY